jgi:hypothetical protein
MRGIPHHPTILNARSPCSFYLQQNKAKKGARVYWLGNREAMGFGGGDSPGRVWVDRGGASECRWGRCEVNQDRRDVRG